MSKRKPLRCVVDFKVTENASVLEHSKAGTCRLCKRRLLLLLTSPSDSIGLAHEEPACPAFGQALASAASDAAALEALFVPLEKLS